MSASVPDGRPGYVPPPPTRDPGPTAVQPLSGPAAGLLDPPPGGHLKDELLPAGEPRPARRLGLRSLTSRLVVGVVALVVVLVAIFSAATYYALHVFLDQRLDQQLENTAGAADRIFNGRPHDGPAAQRVYAVALDPSSGAQIALPAADGGVTALRLSASERRQIASRTSPAPITVDTMRGEQLRITVREAQVISDAGQFPAAVVIGLSTDEERRTLGQLVHLELLIGAAAVLVALIATLTGVRYSLRGLRRVTTTAQDVAYELSPEGRGLERRVPVTEEGTEVGQLAESMNTLLGAVETQFAARLESEHRMRQFLADASHELRTPLTSIRGYAELARMQRAVGEGVDDNLSRIESEGTRMSRLVEDLLTLARGDATDDGERRVKTELIDVDDLLDDVVSGSRAAYPERRIELEVVGDAHLLGDRDQLVRVVRNLVTNAATHTAPERPIRVRGHEDGEEVVIEVVDGGPGLAPDEAAHVFERFWRADKARTRARGGSGLGLSIVAAMVHAHGGTVRFDSSVEHGSTVTVRLPAVRST